MKHARSILVLLSMIVVVIGAIPESGFVPVANAAPRAVPPPRPRKPVPQFVRGEVIEISCYLQDSRNRGDEHAACAQEGILAGGPVGILTGDGTLYIVLGKSSKPPNELLAPFAGKKVKVTGKKLQRARMLAIVLEKVEELPAEKPRAKTAKKR